MEVDGPTLLSGGPRRVLMNKSGIGLYEKGRYLGWVDGKPTTEYRLWDNMISRCKVGGSHQTREPSYIGCSIHPDFIKFQDFAEWCHNQIGFGVEGYQLDKDILVQNNKVYGPDTCCFVPQKLNKLLVHRRSNRGEFPTGVCYCKLTDQYKSRITIDGKGIHIGLFKTPDQAESAYKIAKFKEIQRQAEIWKTEIDPRVYAALMIYVV